ncbi:MAG TPA: hypothetical protein PK504_08530, partial [Ferruginibacter sp.]|nr:hypothetical protein [Ferruginibacter sp.]
MKFFPIFFFALFNISTNCSEGLNINRSKVSDSLIVIKVSRSFPLLTNDGKLLKYENDEAYMFYLNDFILHKQPYTFKFHKLNKDGIYDVEKEEIRNSYFFYKRGSLKGFFTDSSRNLFNVEFKTDSILNRYWHYAKFAEGLLDSTNFETNLILN